MLTGMEIVMNEAVVSEYVGKLEAAFHHEDYEVLFPELHQELCADKRVKVAEAKAICVAFAKGTVPRSKKSAFGRILYRHTSKIIGRKRGLAVTGRTPA